MFLICTGRRSPETSDLISQEVFMKSFGKSQFPHKFVNLSSMILIQRIGRPICVAIDFCKTTLQTLSVRSTLRVENRGRFERTLGTQINRIDNWKKKVCCHVGSYRKLTTGRTTHDYFWAPECQVENKSWPERGKTRAPIEVQTSPMGKCPAPWDPPKTLGTGLL